MKKNIVQDIVPPSKKSIRNIEIPSRRMKVDDTKDENFVQPKKSDEVKTPPPSFDYSASLMPTKETPPESLYKYQYDQPKKPSRKILYTTAIVFIIALIFGISALFKSAKITVASKSQSI